MSINVLFFARYSEAVGLDSLEMEALTAASVAALTIYDMCKALSHDLVIGDTRLLSKEGGKSGGYTAPPRPA